MKRLKLRFRNKWFWLTCGFIALTPVVSVLVNMQREAFTVGGEIFIPLFPLVIWMFSDLWRDLTKCAQ